MHGRVANGQQVHQVVREDSDPKAFQYFGEGQHKEKVVVSVL